MLKGASIQVCRQLSFFVGVSGRIVAAISWAAAFAEAVAVLTMSSTVSFFLLKLNVGLVGFFLSSGFGFGFSTTFSVPAAPFST